MNEKPRGVAAGQAAANDVGLAVQIVEGFEPVKLPPMELVGRDTDGNPILRNQWGAYGHWISVSESLPGMGERVMIAHAVDKWIDVGERDIIGSYEYWSDDGEELGQPTHWMPLPEPPG